jgi:hypothetical protein
VIPRDSRILARCLNSGSASPYSVEEDKEQFDQLEGLVDIQDQGEKIIWQAF